MDHQAITYRIYKNDEEGNPIEQIGIYKKAHIEGMQEFLNGKKKEELPPEPNEIVDKFYENLHQQFPACKTSEFCQAVDDFLDTPVSNLNILENPVPPLLEKFLFDYTDKEITEREIRDVNREILLYKKDLKNNQITMDDLKYKNSLIRNKIKAYQIKLKELKSSLKNGN